MKCKMAVFIGPEDENQATGIIAPGYGVVKIPVECGGEIIKQHEGIGHDYYCVKCGNVYANKFIEKDGE